MPQHFRGEISPPNSSEINTEFGSGVSVTLDEVWSNPSYGSNNVNVQSLSYFYAYFNVHYIDYSVHMLAASGIAKGG